MTITVKKVIAVVLALSSLLALCSCSAGREKIDLEDYITIEFSKYNGYGTASIDVDEDAIENLIDYEKAKKFHSELAEGNNELALELAFIESYTDLFDIDFEEDYENLKNGDKVKVIVTSELEELGYDLKDIEKGLGIKFKDTEITYKVEGLVDAKTLDVFEGIEECLTYTSMIYGQELAINGETKAEIFIPDDFERVVDGMYFVKGNYSNSIKVIYNNTRIDELRFSVQGTYVNLSSGDKINVVVSGGSALEELDYLIPEHIKEYTVPELAERLESKSQLNADRIAKIKSEATKYVQDELGGSNVYELYYYEIKPSSDAKIKCGVVATGNYSGFFRSGYVLVNIKPVILPDGTWTFEMSSAGKMDLLEEIPEKCFDHANYTYTKI